MEMKRVLWPTDFSKNAAQALPHVTSLGEKYQAEVHVLYVIEELAIHEAWYGEFEPSHMDKIHQWERKTAEKRLNEICEKYMEGCPLYVRHIAIGDPATEILKLVREEKIDMVVMASHGHNGQFHFGSVAEKIVKNSPVPVITIPINSGT